MTSREGRSLPRRVTALLGGAVAFSLIVLPTAAVTGPSSTRIAQGGLIHTDGGYTPTPDAIIPHDPYM